MTRRRWYLVAIVVLTLALVYGVLITQAGTTSGPAPVFTP